MPWLLLVGAALALLFLAGFQAQAASSSTNPLPTWSTPDVLGGTPGPKALSADGAALIKNFEGLRFTAYQDPGGTWTIGYGHTGADVYSGLTIDQAAADLFFAQDVAWFEGCVNRAVQVPLTQGQFDALVSLSYNIGCDSFLSSTLLAKLNMQDYAGAGAEFGKWNQDSSGRPLAGLITRRNREAALFSASTITVA